jgi:hypothetical protein
LFGEGGGGGPCDWEGDCGPGGGGGDPCGWGGCGGPGGGWGGSGGPDFGNIPWTGYGGPRIANSIFTGEDCLGCWQLGPSPLALMRAILSGNLVGALQGVGAIPSDAIDCTSGICQVNPVMDASPANNSSTNLLHLDTCIGNNAKTYSIGGLLNLAFNTNFPGSGLLDNTVTSTALFLAGQGGLLSTAWGAGKLGFQGAAAASPQIMTNGSNSLTTITPQLGSPQPVLGSGTNYNVSFLGKLAKAGAAAKGIIDIGLAGALVVNCALGQVH